MRSLLFVPGHDERKLDRALASNADALILDLEDAVPDDAKRSARALSAAFVRENRAAKPLFVRINGLDTPFAQDDLDVVAPTQPFGLLLPKCEGAHDVVRLDADLARREAASGLAVGSMHVLPIVTETAASMFDLGSYARARSPRLWGMLWGAEDLAADVGASANKQDDAYTSPFQLARNLCLFGAAAARVAAVDAVYTNFKDAAGLRDEANAAAVAGFVAKAAIHPGQVDIINEAFTPGREAVQRAQAIVDAFARRPETGAVNIDGRMFDRPHLSAAHRLLARAGHPLAATP